MVGFDSPSTRISLVPVDVGRMFCMKFLLESAEGLTALISVSPNLQLQIDKVCFNGSI